MKRKEKVKAFLRGAAWILIMVCMMMAAVCLILIILQHYSFPPKPSGIEENTIYKVSDEDKTKHPYIIDTDFKGEFSNLSVFDYPFGQSDDYIMNKELIKENREICDTLSGTAEAYIKNAFTIDYRELASDPQSYLERMSKLCVMDIPLIQDMTVDESKIISRAELFEENIDFYVTNRVTMEADFTTGPCLVWKDGYYFVRGIITLTVYSADNIEKFGNGIKLGEPKEIMVDMSFRQEDSLLDGVGPVNYYKMLFLQDTIFSHKFLKSIDNDAQ